ncbi:MAG: leucyl aminopeptidase [Acidobacteria bacterium]|nr:leucyl aminopeptidase [Acidobacteriota bacterium]
MDFKVQDGPLSELAADVVVIPVFENESLESDVLKSLDELTNGLISTIVGTDEMRGKSSDTAYVHVATGLKTRRLLLVGAGTEEKFATRAARNLAGTAARIARKKGATSIAFVKRGGLDLQAFGKSIAEGALIGLYEPDTYKTEGKAEQTVTQISVNTSEAELSAAEQGLAIGNIVGEATNFTRMLVNEPGMQLPPRKLAEHAEQVAAQYGLGVDILDEARMAEFGMGALLGVSRGSDEEAKMIVLTYTPETAEEGTQTIALIGKGLTFDAGGLSLKTSEGMEKMKYDMAGGASVIGAMRAIAQLKPRVKVFGIVPSSENLPSGRALKPGDVLTSMAGKTIEVLNTDAEGRLILADALAYARHLGAQKMVDLATLTGAISVALGTVYCGLFTSNQELADQVLAAGKNADEKFWQLPMDAEYGELIKSDIADLKNIGGKYAGSITAAYFLKEFAGDTPWVHLDIAGVGWNQSTKPYLAKGPSGFSVRTLVEWVMAQ